MVTTAQRVQKRPTGIRGLDSATVGGLPAAGATLIYGGPGAGKTILSLQILQAAAKRGNRSLFITFEESAEQIATDAASFDWGAELMESGHCKLIDARPSYLAEGAGSYDLGGLLALLEHEAAQRSLSWVVLDATDQVLRFNSHTQETLVEIARLNDWAKAQGVSLLYTAKQAEPSDTLVPTITQIEFLLDTVLRIHSEMVGRRQNRRFSVLKYRGSDHSRDELPVVIDAQGVHLPYEKESIDDFPRTGAERVSTGVPALDEVLAGGYFRGSTTLISGRPGTAKTTLAVAFAEAAARRGEVVLYVTFDEVPDRVVRNAASVGIDLQPLIDAGLLHIYAREAWRHLVEEHFVMIARAMDETKARNLVIDPVSALDKSASAEGAYVASERILSAARGRGMTTVLTSLADTNSAHGEDSLSHTSTLVETWLTLGYEVQAGERNRSLSVVKSRGTAHSNQVRELILSDEGITLAEAYQFGSEVLMGTARLERELQEDARHRSERRRRLEERLELETRLSDVRRQAAETERAEALLEARLEALREDEAAAEDTDASHRRAILAQRGRRTRQ